MVKRSRILLLVAVVVLAGGLFSVDVLVPLGLAVWIPYVLVVLLCLWFPHPWQTYTAAAAFSVLMILGLFIPFEGGQLFWLAVLNRLMGVVAIWVAAVIGLAARCTLQLEEASCKLQREIILRERLQPQLLRTQRLESFGALASGGAHYFNNLLSPILMAAKLLKENRSEAERQRLLATLQTSAERGADMVRQLLAFAGGTDSQRTSVQPEHFIREITAIIEHTVPRTIQLSVDLEDNLKQVHADATQLCQVLMNLCINARDAMPTSGTLIVQASNVFLNENDARLHPEAQPGCYVLIAVADTGSGIAAGALDKVFDPFFTTKEVGKGSGLGLSTARDIVRDHGGFISVYSVVGNGSRFAVYLPAEGAAAKSEQKVPGQLSGQGPHFWERPKVSHE